jgi:predicted small metal-binding protein
MLREKYNMINVQVPHYDCMPSFKCKDIGMDCPFTASAPNEAELEKQIAEHARTAHKLTLDKEFWKKIKTAIK